MLEVKRHCRHESLFIRLLASFPEVALVVLLVEMHGLLDGHAVLDERAQVKLELAEEVVRLENVTIEKLQGELVRVPLLRIRRLQLEQEAVIEGGFTGGAAPVRVCLKLLIWRTVEPSAHKDIARAFHVSCPDALTFVHGDAQLVLFDWLWFDVPEARVLILHVLLL